MSNGTTCWETDDGYTYGCTPSNVSADSGFNEAFAEIKELTKHCQFNDCTHTKEKGCAVLKAVNEGELSEQRYQNFIKMNKESIYYEMSYLEKRKKDKQFGKLIKSVMKHKKNKR